MASSTEFLSVIPLPVVASWPGWFLSVPLPAGSGTDRNQPGQLATTGSGITDRNSVELAMHGPAVVEKFQMARLIHHLGSYQYHYL